MFRPVVALVLAILCAHSCLDRVMAQKSAPPLGGALARLEAFPPPQRRVGFVSPLPISDTVPYMFYGTFRSRVMLIEQSLQLRGYDTASARAALGELDDALAGIKNRGVEIVVVGGSVLSFAYAHPALLTRLEEAVSNEHDAHGRFPASAALAVRSGFSQRPLADEYVEVLWWALRKLWPSLERRPQTFATQPIPVGDP